MNDHIQHLITQTKLNPTEFLIKYQNIKTIQFLIIILIIVFLMLANKFRKSILLEKRISKYSITSFKDINISLFDSINLKYKQLVKNLSKILSKSYYLKKHSKKFEKYIGTINNNWTDSINFIAEKIIMSIIFLIIAFISKIFQNKIINIYEIITALALGYLGQNIIYSIKYKKYRKVLENDFLQAVIIMNNAFKSGRSIIQAIDLVGTELEGPISKEFQKMHTEFKLGLSMGTIFKRFSERINLEEATYLNVSLTILNKTGGNIIKVFSSIEKTLFNKKKLKLELLALTGGSKIIVFILLTLPLFFILIINLMNPSYFIPFLTTIIGRFLVVIMLLIYIAYAFIIRKIMKVRM